MKNSTNIIKILFLSLFSIATIMGQNPAFVYLPDMTGYSLEDSEDHLKDSLLAAAESLRAALPDTAMQNDFAVYDMGFYKHHAAMTGGVQKVMADAISDRITHSYYLLFGREMDREGRIKKVWVEVELPNTAQFCYWEDGTFSHLKFMVDIRANAAKGLSMTDRNAIFDAMENGISYMADRVAQLVECCSSSFRQQCDCGWSFDAIETLIGTRNFFEVEAEVIPSQVVNTECPCFDDPEIIFNSAEGANYEVISKVSIDSIKFGENKVLAISDVFEVFEEMGKQFEELYEGNFFAAITDQYAFCSSEPGINALRMQGLSYDPYEYDRMIFDGDEINMAFWLHVSHDNGQATVSIKGGGNVPFNITSAIATFYACWNTTDDWTSYTACAINNILFSGQIIVDRADDFVIKGKNNSSIKVINDILTLSVQTGLDFGGEHVIADLSNQIFGIQNTASKGGSAYVTVRHGGHLNAILFLSGDYAGYWYYYSSIFGRGGYKYGGAQNYALDLERSFLYGWTDKNESNTPETFRGNYKGILLSGEIGVYKGLVGVGISGGINRSYVPDPSDVDPNWTVLQAGYGVSIGPGNVGFAFAVNGEIGKVSKISKQIKTLERSRTAIIGNWALTLIIM